MVLLGYGKSVTNIVMIQRPFFTSTSPHLATIPLTRASELVRSTSNLFVDALDLNASLLTHSPMDCPNGCAAARLTNHPSNHCPNFLLFSLYGLPGHDAIRHHSIVLLIGSVLIVLY